MLAKIAPTTNNFHRVARYLIQGKAGTTPSPKRIAWTKGHNLPSDDPELAAKIMTATASLSPRTRKAVYHLMIGWHAREGPTPEVMQEIAIETLLRAGLSENEALLVAHGDSAHPHVHLMINRVHPITGKAWQTSHDFARFDRIMQDLADQYGFSVAPVHRFNPEATYDQPKGPNTPATFAAKRGAPTRRPQWSRHHADTFGARLSADLPTGATLDDLQDLLTDYGLSLTHKGQGLIIGDAQSYTKFSSLGLVLSGKDTIQRRPVPHTKRQPQPRRSFFDVDTVDLARAFAAWGLLDHSDVQAAVIEANEVRNQTRHHTLIDKLINSHHTATMLSPTTPRHRPRIAQTKQHQKCPQRGHRN